MRALLAAILVSSAPAVAAAQSVTCEPAEADLVAIDGMLDDWAGVKPVRGGGTDRDASFDLRCLIAGGTLWLAADVRDERVVRTPTGGGDDALEVTLGKLVIVARPGVDGKAPARTVGGKAAPRWLGVEDSLQPAGWSLELAIPTAKIAGWSHGAAIVVRLRDGDVPRGKVTETTVAWTGALAEGGVVDQRAALLAALRQPATAVTFEQAADVDPDHPGPETVLLVGGDLALVSDQFAYSKLPVTRAADVVRTSLLDLRGDGSRVIAVELRARSGDLTRELVTLWTADRGALVPIGAIEIGRSRGDRRLHSTWKLVPGKAWAKQTGGAKKVIEVRAEPAVGWDEDSYDEPRSTDAEPVHVPWDDDRVGGVFWLGAAGQLEAMSIKRTR